jgi:hypothetical protein
MISNVQKERRDNGINALSQLITLNLIGWLKNPLEFEQINYALNPHQTHTKIQSHGRWAVHFMISSRNSTPRMLASDNYKH